MFPESCFQEDLTEVFRTIVLLNLHYCSLWLSCHQERQLRELLLTKNASRLTSLNRCRNGAKARANTFSGRSLKQWAISFFICLANPNTSSTGLPLQREGVALLCELRSLSHTKPTVPHGQERKNEREGNSVIRDALTLLLYVFTYSDTKFHI